jgi:hypothetical protein
METANRNEALTDAELDGVNGGNVFTQAMVDAVKALVYLVNKAGFPITVQIK